jgi:hypothetical protein
MPTLPISLQDLEGEVALPADVTLAALVPTVAGTALESAWLQNARVAPVDGGGVRITADLPDLYLESVALEIPASCDRVSVTWHAPPSLHFPDVDWLSFDDAALTMQVADGRLRGEIGGVLHVGALTLPLAVGLPPPDSGWVFEPTFERVSVGDVAAFAATFGVSDLTASLPPELADALDKFAVTGLRLHYQPLGRIFKAFAVDLEIDATWQVVPGLALERPTLALSVLNPASRASRLVSRRLSAVVRLGALRLPVRVTSEAGAHTLEIEADDIPVPRFADLVALVGPAVELPVDLPALRLSDVSIGVDAARKARLTVAIEADLAGELPGFPTVGMSGFTGNFAVDAGVLSGRLTGGLTLGAASLGLVLERADAAAEWRFTATSRPDSGPLSLSAALAGLMSGAGLSPGLPDFGLADLSLAVTPKLGQLSFAAAVTGAWTVPVGVADLVISDLHVALARAGSGQATTCSVRGKLSLGGVTLEIGAAPPGGLALTASADGLRPWGVIESLCGSVFDEIPIPEQLRALTLTTCTVTIDPVARTLAIRGAAAGFAAIELRAQRDARGAWGVALALAPAGGADLATLLGVQGLGDLSLGDVVFVLSSIHAPALRFAAPQFAAVAGVTRGFGFSTRVGLAELGVGTIPGMSTAPLAVQARFGRTLADFSLAAAMAAPGGRIVIDPPSGLALVDPELRIAPANGEVVIGGRVDVVLAGERLEFAGGFKMTGGVAMYASMKGDWREPFGIRGVIARALSVELKFPPGAPSLAGTLVIGGRTGTLKIKPDPTAPVLDLWLESLDLQDVLGSIADVALADVPASVRRTVCDVRFADVRLFIAPRATTLGDVPCPAGMSLRGKMIAWGLEIAAHVMTRTVGTRKALRAEGVATLPALGDDLKIRDPYFKLELEPGKIPEVRLEAAVEVLGVTLAEARIRLDDSGFAVDLEGAIFGGAMSAALEVRGGRFSPTATYGVTATLDIRFLQDLLGEAVRALTAVVGDANREIERARTLLTTIEQKGQAIAAESELRRRQIQERRDADARQLREAEAALQAARARLDVLTREVDAAKATVEAERAAVKRQIDAAQADVDAATRAVNGLTGEINATNRWFYGLPKVAWPWIASQAREGAWYGIKIGGLYAARETATGVLNVARQALQAVVDTQRSFPVELDPRVAGLIAARASANIAVEASQRSVALTRETISLVPVDADFRLLALKTAREALNLQMVAARTAFDLADGALDGLARLGAALIPSVRIDRASFACDLAVAAGGSVRMSVDVTTHTGSRNFAVDLDLRSPMSCATALINILLGTDGRKAVEAVAQNNAATVGNVAEAERKALPTNAAVVLRSLGNAGFLAVRPRALRYGDKITIRTTSSHHLREIGGSVDAWQNHESGPECVWTILKADAPGSTEPVRYGDAVALRSHVNTYLVAEDSGPINANRGAIGPWERWTLVLPDNSGSRAPLDLTREIGLRSWRGHYLGSNDDGFNGGRIYAIHGSLGEWESWVITSKTPGTVVSTTGGGPFDADGQFEIKRSGDLIGLLSTRTGRYVSVASDFSVHADSPNFAGAEQFRLEGDYLVHGATGRYLRLGDGDNAVMERIFGSLKYVECAADGSVWGVNSGDEIYRWNGGGWDLIPGGLRQISVGSASHVWGVNSSDMIYRWNGTSWHQIPGLLRHVSVAADGTTWGVNSALNIFRYRPSGGWDQMPGGASQVAVGTASHVWVNTPSNIAYRWNGSSWDPMPGRLRHVSVTADGTVFGVNMDHEACLWTGSDWRPFAGNTLQVGGGSATRLWRVTTDLQIDRTDFRRLPGDIIDCAATSKDARASFEMARPIVASSSVSQIMGPPQYPAGDVQIATLSQDATASAAVASAGPGAEQTAALEANLTRTQGEGAVAPVLSRGAAAEADRLARRQRTLEKAGAPRPELDQAIRDSALRFDGASYLELAARRPTLVDGVVGSAPTLPLGARFTVEAWIAPERLGVAEQAIVSKWGESVEDELLLMLGADGRPQIAWHVDGANTWATAGWNILSANEAVKLDAWTHVAAVRDGDRISLHIDGREVAAATGLGAAPLRAGVSPWRIGAAGPNRRNFVGLIDSVRVWGVALAPAELRARRFLVARGDEHGLLACWNMDEAGGDTTFDSGRGELHARLVGQVQRAHPGGPEGPPLADRHLTLAGTGHVSAGDVDLLGASTTLTIEAWILVDSVAGDLAVIAGKSAQAKDEYLFAVRPDNTLAFAWRCQGSTEPGTPGWNQHVSAAKLPFGRWCHVAVVRDGKWIRLFCDGRAIGAGEVASDQPLRHDDAPLCLGSEGGTRRHFVGSLAEVRIWRTARGEAAIRDTYRRPLVGDETGLLALWRLDEGWGTSLRDVGATARHASLVGVASWPPRGGPPRIVGPTRGLRCSGAQYIEYGDDDLFSASIAITIESWVRLDALVEDFSAIVNKWTTNLEDEYLLAISRDGHLVFGWHNQGSNTYGTPGYKHILSDGTITLDRWTHIAVVRAGRTVSFYIDGAPAGSFEAADLEPLRNGTAALRIGGHGPGVGRYLRGDLAGLRIWRTARTPEQLATSMAGLVSSRTPGRVLDLRFDEREGTASVLDAANGRTGAAIGVGQPPPANIAVILPVRASAPITGDSALDPRRPALDAARRARNLGTSAALAIAEIEAALAQIERVTPGAVVAVLAAAGYPPAELAQALASVRGHTPASIVAAFFAGERPADEALQAVQSVIPNVTDSTLVTLASAAGYSPESLGDAMARVRGSTAAQVAQVHRELGLLGAHAARAAAAAMSVSAIASPAALARVLLTTGHAPATIGEALTRLWDADASTIVRAVQRAGGDAAAALAASQISRDVLLAQSSPRGRLLGLAAVAAAPPPQPRLAAPADAATAWPTTATILPGNFSGAGARTEVLVYDASQGPWAVYRWDGVRGWVPLCAPQGGWRTTWRIVPIQLPGSAQTHVFLHDPTRGEALVLRWNPATNGMDGVGPLMTGLSANVQIIPGDFAPGAGLLFYDPVAGTGTVMGFDTTSGLVSRGPVRSEWSRNARVVPTHVAGLPHTCFLMYLPGDGSARVFRWDPVSGEVPVSPPMTGWQRNWNILPAHDHARDNALFFHDTVSGNLYCFKFTLIGGVATMQGGWTLANGSLSAGPATLGGTALASRPQQIVAGDFGGTGRELYLHRTPVYFHLVDSKHNLCTIAGDVWDQKTYHQLHRDRANALWTLEPVAGQPDVYRIRDAKHGEYLVAGDVYDQHVYHQDHQNRPNAQWKLVRIVDQGREVYHLVDQKHQKALVAGDVADGSVYHQDPLGRANARWVLVEAG